MNCPYLFYSAWGTSFHNVEVSRILEKVPFPKIRWSKSGILSIRAASSNWRVSVMSSGLGEVFPDGWLCAIIKRTAPLLRTSRKISRGWARVSVAVPIVIMRWAIIRFLLSSITTARRSCGCHIRSWLSAAAATDGSVTSVKSGGLA